MKNNNVSGRITHKESGTGIPNLIISILDIDPNYFNPDHDDSIGDPHIVREVESIDDVNRSTINHYADRIGSIITDAVGNFELIYSDDAFQIRKKVRRRLNPKKTVANDEELRPDLFLEVATPDSTANTPLLYRSKKVRLNAGRQETYLIELSTKDLERAGISPPLGFESINNENNSAEVTNAAQEPLGFKAQIEKSLNKRTQQRKEIKEVYAKFLKEERKTAIEKKEKFTRPFQESISKVDAALKSTRNFVKNNESVKEKTNNVIKSNIEDFYNNNVKNDRKPQKGIIHLTDAEFNDLKGNNGDDVNENTEVDSEKFQFLLNGNEEDITDLIFTHPLAQWCREKTAPETICAALLKKVETEEINNEESPDQDNPIEENNINNLLEPADADRDVPLFIANQMKKVASPEDPVIFDNRINNTSTRADQETIDQNISALKLQQGPADSPAFHDFHHVKIAFEHVWQELFDQDLLNVAEELFDRIVELGGEPEEIVEPGGISEDLAKKFGLVAREAISLEKNTKSFVPDEVESLFAISDKVWKALHIEKRTRLQLIVDDLDKIDQALNILQSVFDIQEIGILLLNGQMKLEIEGNSKIVNLIIEVKVPAPRHLIDLKKAKARENELMQEKTTLFNEGKSIIQNAEQKVDEDEIFDGIPSPEDLETTEILKDLEARLKEDYAFKVYAANKKERSINFGILVTYRQKWEPQAYQAGELVKTIPLAPKEIKKYSKKEVRKKKRVEKEIENSLRIIKEDTSETGRAESEIMAKAGKTSNFTMNATGSINAGLKSASGSIAQTNDASKESSDLKKNFRESVIKAAQEYKDERKLEITTEETFESEYTESGEISNPNDELTVTYLFYELQRRYKIYERLHRVRPVIFVAQEVPQPNEIDEDWILTYDWILRRVLLDDSFMPAINYVGNNITSLKICLQQLKRNLILQRKIVNRLQGQVGILKDEVNNRYRLFEAAVDKHAGLSGSDNSNLIETVADIIEPSGVVSDVAGFLGFGGDDNEKKIEAARIRREAAMSAYEKAARDRDSMIVRLDKEINSLSGQSTEYTKKVSEFLTMKTQIQRLKVHIKQNIMHYMQAIWSHEPTDQRFFRLFQTPVPIIDGTLSFEVTKKAFTPISLFANAATVAVDPSAGNLPDYQPHEYKAKPEFETDFEFTTLEQVADIDDMLGFKGNYMILPLKKANKLTDFMLAPYLDNLLGLRDPDEFGEWTLDDFAKYVCCLKEQLPEATFERMVPDLKAIYGRLLTNPLRQGEEITIPTGSLFIEALPGVHPILENFKLTHRAIDVKKVQAEVREMELENIRLAARLLKGELDDPDVEKKIVVQGDTSVIVGDE